MSTFASFQIQAPQYWYSETRKDTKDQAVSSAASKGLDQAGVSIRVDSERAADPSIAREDDMSITWVQREKSLREGRAATNETPMKVFSRCPPVFLSRLH